MNHLSLNRAGFCVLMLSAGLAVLWPAPVPAQWPFAPATTPDAQRNALSAVKAQVSWLQNATRTASNFGAQGNGNVWQTFQAVRLAFNAFKLTLTPQQLTYGANDLAELEAGLNILEEAFAYYEQDLAAGQSASAAIRNLCRVLRQSVAIWLQELTRTCSRLRVGSA